MRGEIISAEKDLRKALELNPEDPELLNHLGYSLLLWYEGKKAGSGRCYKSDKAF